MTDAYSVGQILGNRIAQTPPAGDASNRVITSKFISQGIVISPTGTTQGINISQTPSGTSSSGNVNFNQINIVDTEAITGGFFGNGLSVTENINGPVQGGRQGIIGNAFLNVSTSTTNTNRNYVGVVGVGNAVVGDNGTNPASLGSSDGAIFGGNFIGILGSSAATAFLNVTGAEFNARVVTGASVAVKTLAQFSSDSSDQVQGSVVDAMLWLSNQTTGNPGWNTGILFDTNAGAWPLKSTGTLIQTAGAGTAAKGIDFTSTNFTGNAFASPSFSVDGVGDLVCFQFAATGTIFRTQTPATLTGTTGTLNSASQIINASGTFTLTLPSPAVTGQWLWIRSIAAQLVNSASNNVVPLAGGAAQSTILAASAGKWANLQADGTNWQVMAGN